MQGLKTGGRQIGTPNKVTSELRTVLKDIFFTELKNLPELLKQLEPKERLAILSAFLPYVLPKVQTVSHKDDEPW
jgi:hypothetical protein